jgi:hypothetical protein
VKSSKRHRLNRHTGSPNPYIHCVVGGWPWYDACHYDGLMRATMVDHAVTVVVEMRSPGGAIGADGSHGSTVTEFEDANAGSSTEKSYDV